MWIATEHGFYSAVQHRDNKKNVIVRARVRKDLERLTEALHVKAKIVDSPTADYPFRVTISKKDWSRFLSDAGSKVDYPNFKSRVGKHDHSREKVYHEVWAALMKLEEKARGWWGHEDAGLLALDEIDEFDKFDPEEPYLCQFCDETLVGFYDQCPWCGEDMWTYDEPAEEMFG